MPGFTIDQILNIALGVVFGGGISAVAAARMRKDVATSAAETHVVTLLRSELDRLHKANEEFSAGVATLKEENAELRSELVLLRAEVQRLRELAETPRACPKCGGPTEAPL